MIRHLTPKVSPSSFLTPAGVRPTIRQGLLCPGPEGSGHETQDVPGQRGGPSTQGCGNELLFCLPTSRFRVTHIEKRYGSHEHRDGSPTDRSWGSGGGQDPGGQGSGGGQPRAGMPATERLPAEAPQPQALASPPVQNGGLRDSSRVPCTLEGNPGASAELTLGARGRGPSPGLPRQEANGQPSKPDTSDYQV